ncbi:MAG: hypothetical protein KAT15_26700, partial [Bacteroidales bacterium]|nr:hypothetical protein [Bacteroidales bacterium]
IAFGQTIKTDGVLIVHELNTILDGATLDKMMDEWVENITPEVKKHFPEATFHWVKGIGADNKNAIASFAYYNSLSDYRKYFNEDGTLTEAGGAAYAALMPVAQELMAKYGEMSWILRDWVIIK